MHIIIMNEPKFISNTKKYKYIDILYTFIEQQF